MNTYVILIRGINVGGKNKVPMAGLKKCLEELVFSFDRDYARVLNNIMLQQGNVVATLGSGE